MALGILSIIFIVLFVLVVIGQFFLYSSQENQFWVIWNTLLGIVIAFMAYTSLPSNYVVQKTIALVWGIIALVAFILQLRNNETSMLVKVLLTISVVGGIVQLFM